MKVFILHLNYVIQGSANQTSPDPSQSWSCITLRKSKTSRHHHYFSLKQKAFPCSVVTILYKDNCNSVSLLSLLFFAFCTPTHIHSCCLAKWDRRRLIALSFAWRGLTVVGSVWICFLHRWGTEGPWHICIPINTWLSVSFDFSVFQ